MSQKFQASFEIVSVLSFKAVCIEVLSFLAVLMNMDALFFLPFVARHIVTEVEILTTTQK